MSGSSGVHADTTVRYEVCSAELETGDTCGWEGNVDVAVDPEIRQAVWDCPDCQTIHDATEEIFG